MGKNQAYKAMQRSRSGSTSAGPDEIDDGMVDGSFHSPEWHAARLASLKTSHTITWEEYKKKQKEDEIKKGELEADKDRMMREYRAQLDAERAKKLGHGRNHSGSKSSRKKGRMRILRSEAAAERERVQREDHQSHHLQVHHQSLQVVMRKKKSQEDLDRAQRRKEKRKGTDQEQSIPAAATKRIKVPSPCLNSSAVLRADDRPLFEATVVFEFKKWATFALLYVIGIAVSEHKFVFFTIITTPFSLPLCASARQ